MFPASASRPPFGPLPLTSPATAPVVIIKSAAERVAILGMGFSFTLVGSGSGCGCRMVVEKPFKRLLPVLQKKHGREKCIKQGCRGKAAEYRDGNRVQDFCAGRARRKKKGNKRKTRRKRRHHDRGQPLQASANNKITPEALAFVDGKVDVVTDFENSIARGNACQGNETDHARHRQLQVGEIKRDYAANEGQWNVAHND